MGAIVQKRALTQGDLKKQAKAEQAKIAWANRAREIKAGNKESMLTILEKRGYVNQIVGDRDELDHLMTEKRVGMYVGVDPTAPSLHVGHLLPLMVLYRAYLNGFYVCSLLGGATAEIGDPIGRTGSRGLLQSAERKSNTTKINSQLLRIWGNVEKCAEEIQYDPDHLRKWEVISNATWLQKLPALELLKHLGYGVRLGTMLGKDTVKNRLEKGQGMSFAEFTYPLLQSWDWWHLYKTKDVQIQIGGADQFGNILAGMEAVKSTKEQARTTEETGGMDEGEMPLEKPMGFTVPLLTTASGEKFGKSAGNAIWLDREMTSAFDLYQFFLKMADADVHRYLKLLTFMSLGKVEETMREHLQEPSRRLAQHTLAREVLGLVHGREVAAGTEIEHRSLFRPRITAKSSISTEHAKPPSESEDILNTPKQRGDSGMPSSVSLTLPRSLVYNQPLSKILYHAGLVPSRSEGFRLVAHKGAYIGTYTHDNSVGRGQIEFSSAANLHGSETEKHIQDGSILILRVGKSKMKFIRIIGDDEFNAQGLSAPGWQDTKPEQPTGGPAADNEAI